MKPVEKPNAQSLVEKLKAASLVVCAAESCTSGLIADAFAQIPGASAVFYGSYICYTERAKKQMLGVTRETLERSGAVSAETAHEMVIGALERSGADAALSVTGLAGPESDRSGKPIGTVWISAALAGTEPCTRLYHFTGNRPAIRAAAAQAAIALLEEILA